MTPQHMFTGSDVSSYFRLFHVGHHGKFRVLFDFQGKVGLVGKLSVTNYLVVSINPVAEFPLAIQLQSAPYVTQIRSFCI